MGSFYWLAVCILSINGMRSWITQISPLKFYHNHSFFFKKQDSVSSVAIIWNTFIWSIHPESTVELTNLNINKIMTFPSITLGWIFYLIGSLHTFQSLCLSEAWNPWRNTCAHTDTGTQIKFSILRTKLFFFLCSWYLFATE